MGYFVQSDSKEVDSPEDEKRIVIPSDYPEALRRIMDISDEVLRVRFSLDPAMCTQAGFRIAEGIRREFGGTEVYFCKYDKMELTARDWEIFRSNAFRRVDIDALAIQYNLSSVRVRQIIKACAEQELKRNQLGLF